MIKTIKIIAFLIAEQVNEIAHSILRNYEFVCVYTFYMNLKSEYNSVASE